MAELKQLIKKLATVKSGLTVFINFLRSISDKPEVSQLDLTNLSKRLAIIENYLTNFNDYQAEIELLCDDSKADEQFMEREQFERSYFEAVSRAENMLQNQGDKNDEILAIHSCPHSEHLNDLSSHGIKLPDIHLPKFSGKFEDWLEFRDIYKSLIHDNKILNNIQKFHYLRGALEGTAAASISKITYTADNYEVAWTTITNRFDNKKKLIYEHIKAIFSIESTQKQTSEKIQGLKDDINKHLGSIEQLGQTIENWDPLLIFWLTNKLGSVSNLEWERETNFFFCKECNFVNTLESKNNLQINKQESKSFPMNKQSRHTSARSLVSAN
ncbi:hypothetical protein JTB14_021111 [Gonioctena quinquepunctata]|nr:hypothetical protein JTB14_021111 [Gonioctena quinquepunctata]